LLTIVFTGLDDYATLGALGDGGVAEAAGDYLAGWIGAVVAAAAILGAFTTLNAIVTSYSRTLMRAARDDVVNSKLAELHPTTGVPHWAILVLALPPVLLIPLNPGPVVLPVFIALTILFGGFLSAIALWNLPKRFPEAYQNSIYRLPLPLLRVAAIGSGISSLLFWLAVAPQRLPIVGAILLLAASGAVYHRYHVRHHERAGDQLDRLEPHEAVIAGSGTADGEPRDRG
jgi:basic amino acid/polyamine antiporter, APA family